MKPSNTKAALKRAGTRSRAKNAHLGLSDEIARLETEAPVHEPTDKTESRDKNGKKA